MIEINGEKRRCYKFAHFQLFKVKYKFVNLELFDAKFLFSGKHIFRKQKIAAVYGCAFLASNFKLARKNDDLLSSRLK